MIKAATYRTDTGEITGFVACPEALLNMQAGEGESIFINPPHGATHIVNGEALTIEPTPPPKTLEQMAQDVVNAVQRHLDNTARTRNYDGILSLASYAASTDPVFRAEGEAGAAWRDACWRICYQGLAEVQAGTRPMPTPEEAIAALPVMEWPTV